MATIWIVLHEYKEGVSPYLVRCKGKPTEGQAKKIVEDFKARSGDTIRVIGPYVYDAIPEIGKRRGSAQPMEEPEEDFDPFEDDT